MGIYTSYTYEYNKVDYSNYDPLNESYNILIESQINYNNMMKDLKLNQLSSILEDDTTTTNAAFVDNRSFGEKVKLFFKKIWEGIKSFFGKFTAMWDQFIKSDSEFISKYKARILRADLRNFSYSGFIFTLDKVKPFIEKGHEDTNRTSTFKNLKAAATKYASITSTELSKYDDVKTMYDLNRGYLIGEKSSYTTSEFTKELFEKLRNGVGSKEVLDKINVSDQLMIISETSKAKLDIDKLYRTAERSIRTTMKEFEKFEKAIMSATMKKSPADSSIKGREKAVLEMSIINRYYNTQQQIQNDLQILRASYLTALKDRNKQARSICIKAIQHNPDKAELKTESKVFLDELFII